MIFSFPMPLGRGMKKENEKYEPHSECNIQRDSHLMEREREGGKSTHSIGNHPEVVSLLNLSQLSTTKTTQKWY